MTNRPSFSDCYAELLEARAGVHKEFPIGPNVDRDVEAALARVQAAEWRLIQTPAIDFADIRLRAAVVQDLFTSAERDGEYADRRDMMMLAALVSEISNYSEPLP